MTDSNIIIGKRVVLFNLEPPDLEHFVRIHREDKNGYLQRYCLKEMTQDEATKYVLALLSTNQVRVFTVLTKEGKKSRKAGYIYITDLSTRSCSLTGILDREFTTGLAKQLRKGKNTFSQDALHCILGYCFLKLGLDRVESDVMENNRLAMALLKKEGFKKEGILRRYAYINGQSHDVAIFSMLKEEFRNGQVERTGSQDTDVREAETTDVPNTVG